MEELNAKAGVELDIGRRGEHLARRVVFDVTAWELAYGEGTAFLLHMRNGDRYPYPVVITREDGKVMWDVTRTDLAVVGKGLAELQYWAGDTRVKSVVFSTRTAPCLDNEGPYPDAPEAGWVERVLEGVDNDHECPPSGELSEIEVQSGVDDFVEKPADGFYGIGKVKVKGSPRLLPENIKKNVEILGVVGSYAPSVKLSDNDSVTITQNGTRTVYPSSGHDAMNKLKVITQVPTELNLMSKSLSITENGSRRVSPDSSHNGLSYVDVNVNVPVDAELTTGSVTIERNGTHYVYPPDGADGMTMVTVNAQVPTNVEGRRSVTIQENGTFSYGPTDSDYAGIKGIDVTVNVPTTMDLQSKSWTLNRGAKTVYPDEGKVLSSVKINWDGDITPENIKEGVEIFGVRGTYQSPMDELTVIPSTDEQLIYPVDGIYGFNKVKVLPAAPSGDYNEGFAAGVASRDEEVAQLQARITQLQAERDAAYQEGYDAGYAAGVSDLGIIRAESVVYDDATSTCTVTLVNGQVHKLTYIYEDGVVTGMKTSLGDIVRLEGVT